MKIVCCILFIISLNLANHIFNLPNVFLKNRAEKFDIKYKNYANLLCQMVKYL